MVSESVLAEDHERFGRRKPIVDESTGRTEETEAVVRDVIIPGKPVITSFQKTGRRR